MTGYNKPSPDELTKGRLEETPNHTVVQRISRPKELILLFWANERNQTSYLYTDAALFEAAAKTRESNIKKAAWYVENLHKVHSIPMLAIHEIGIYIREMINKYGGYTKAKVKEIGVFSHAGFDGPITYHSSAYPPLDPKGGNTQMHVDGWKAINFNWIKEGASCIFYGCQTSLEGNSFAKKLSLLENFQNVAVWGQTTFSYPSYFPDYRVTSSERNTGVGWSFGQTYLVGGVKGKGWESTYIGLTLVDNLTKEEIKKYPKAIPMQAFKNGEDITFTHQGVFNDHRPNT